ncbi:MAG: hypothetical protein ABSD85_00140 [Acidimicrobiales bacterium]
MPNIASVKPKELETASERDLGAETVGSLVVAVLRRARRLFTLRASSSGAIQVKPKTRPWRDTPGMG